MKTMIELTPSIKSHLMHSNPIKGHLIALALLIGPIYLIINIQWSVPELIIGSLLGIIYWSFFEYAIHRYIYHTIFKSKIQNQFWQSFHLYHHRNIDDKEVLNANYLFLLPMAFINSIVLFLICALNLSVFIFAVTTLIISYIFYEWVHYTIHMNPTRNNYIKFISKYHLHHHHKNASKNFGNTNYFWDRVLGTYDPAYKHIDLNSVKY